MGDARPATIAPVTKRIEVPLPPAEAFALFTSGIATWWPLSTHSISEKEVITCAFEAGAGGRIYETDADGNEHEWGRVQVWEPPNRVVYSWFPGRSDSTAQEVEIRFSATGTGTTLELEHRGWEALGERAEAYRTDYDNGWDVVLGRYLDRARA